MGRVLRFRRIVASFLVVGSAAAGLAVATAGSAGAGREPPNCEVEGGPSPAILQQPALCSTLEVTKVVNGTAPEGTIFRVVVQCESRPAEREAGTLQLPPGQLPPFTVVLEFPASGGTQEVLIAGPSSCSASETPPPGCTLASIAPPSVQFTQPNQTSPILVTNNCTAPAAAAAAAEQSPVVVVVAAPRLTG